MSANTVNRNLRDGQVQIKDGTGTPKVCTLLCDEGNFSWNESKEWRVTRCRGTLDLDSVREGDTQECEVSVTASWQQLISRTVSGGGSDPIMPYEIINDVGGTTFTSVATGHYALKWVFTVTAPGEDVDGNDETITFAAVRKQSLRCAEGDERNTLEFQGIDNEEMPTIARIPASP